MRSTEDDIIEHMAKQIGMEIDSAIISEMKKYAKIPFSLNKKYVSCIELAKQRIKNAKIKKTN